jgi:hypothetical protein
MLRACMRDIPHAFGQLELAAIWFCNRVMPCLLPLLLSRPLSSDCCMLKACPAVAAASGASQVERVHWAISTYRPKLVAAYAT